MFGLDGLACHDSANPWAVVVVEIAPALVELWVVNVVLVAAPASRRGSPLLSNSTAAKAARGRILVQLWKLWLMQ